MEKIIEKQRLIPVVENTDILVAGAGPAGIAAAIMAARLGVRVRLIENHGCLGGIWTAGLMTWIHDGANKPGFIQELIEELKWRYALRVRLPGSINFGFDPEVMKLLLEEMAVTSGVKIRLHTRVVGALRNENNNVSTIITESKSGREAWGAKMVIDCTGDGDVAAQLGCEFDVGHPESGVFQPMTLLAFITGVQFKEIEPYIGVGGYGKAKRRLLEEMKRAGVTPSYSNPAIMPITDELFTIMTNHQYHVPATDAQAITDATIEARAEVTKIMHALRSLGGVWQNLRIVATGEQIGVREGRRIRGRYTVTLDDMVAGIRHEDAVCRGHFGLDVHTIDPSDEKSYRPKVKIQPYDIPLRSLIAKDIGGLMMAGRCISGDFFAHSSYRVTGDASTMGQAAGITAALAIQQECMPHDVSWDVVQEQLLKLKQPS